MATAIQVCDMGDPKKPRNWHDFRQADLGDIYAKDVEVRVRGPGFTSWVIGDGRSSFGALLRTVRDDAAWFLTHTNLQEYALNGGDVVVNQNVNDFNATVAMLAIRDNS